MRDPPPTPVIPTRNPTSNPENAYAKWNSVKPLKPLFLSPQENGVCLRPEINFTIFVVYIFATSRRRVRPSLP